MFIKSKRNILYIRQWDTTIDELIKSNTLYEITHVILCYLQILSNNHGYYLKYNDLDQDTLKNHIFEIKNLCPKLKILISVSNPTDLTESICNTFSIDGIDFPLTAYNYQQHMVHINEFKNKFPDTLVSLTMYANQVSLCNIGTLCEYGDTLWMNILFYDCNGDLLYGNTDDNPNLDMIIHRIKDKSKLNIGILAHPTSGLNYYTWDQIRHKLFKYLIFKKNFRGLSYNYQLYSVRKGRYLAKMSPI